MLLSEFENSDIGILGHNHKDDNRVTFLKEAFLSKLL
jgi:hypothetical protein